MLQKSCEEATISVEECNTNICTQNKDMLTLSASDISRFKAYNLDDYIFDIETSGIQKTWALICRYVLTFGENKEFLNIKNFGELYEIALALRDKLQKKNSGQYYTPDDVALIMSEWLDKVTGENICDVACGTGKLILAYLDYIGKSRAEELIKCGKIYLYDADNVALEICKTSILMKYGLQYEDKIHVFHSDFLDKEIKLPKNCKTISNPPYAAIHDFGKNWEQTEVLTETKEYYSAFMEKIVKQSQSTVIITPFSFISGNKFYSLRKVLNNYCGEVYSFDNVPGNIFCGRKHGIFNTNTSNSVRAAITVVSSEHDNGFRLTPLIRFKSTERKKLLNCAVLENFLPKDSQKITDSNTMYYKCFKQLQPLLECLNRKANGHTIRELIDNKGKYIISVPSTCRYYTTAAAYKMNRNGQIIMTLNDEKVFYYLFCLINSSFAYWNWRLYDGGITYPTNLLMQTPSIFHLLTEKDFEFFEKTAKEMIDSVSEYIIKKNNVGIQENIKYPKVYRDRINERMLQILNSDMDYSIFDIIHSNMALEINL